MRGGRTANQNGMAHNLVIASILWSDAERERGQPEIPRFGDCYQIGNLLGQEESRCNGTRQLPRAVGTTLEPASRSPYFREQARDGTTCPQPCGNITAAPQIEAALHVSCPKSIVLRLAHRGGSAQHTRVHFRRWRYRPPFSFDPLVLLCPLSGLTSSGFFHLMFPTSLECYAVCTASFCFPFSFFFTFAREF